MGFSCFLLFFLYLAIFAINIPLALADYTINYPTCDENSTNYPCYELIHEGDNLTKIPLILVHGDNNEKKDKARWNRFQEYVISNRNTFSEFDIYIWKHDTSEPIGFNGNTGNAEELAEFVDALISEKYANISEVLFLAHSRGGLVCRSFMNFENNKDVVLGMITLGSPHHGSPFAVPDWSAAVWHMYNWIVDPVFNFLYLPFGLFGSDPPFDTNREGSLNLAWDNLDNAIEGLITSDFNVWFSYNGKIYLTEQDTNTPITNEADKTNLYSTLLKENNGTLSELFHNEYNKKNSGYFNKIVTFGAFDNKLGENSTDSFYQQIAEQFPLIRDVYPYMGEHNQLALLTDLLSSYSGNENDFKIVTSNQTYYANDGLVPLQSALFLDINGGVSFSEILDFGKVSIDLSLIAEKSLCKRNHIFTGGGIDGPSQISSTIIHGESGINDHLDLLDTDNEQYWNTIAVELNDFANNAKAFKYPDFAVKSVQGPVKIIKDTTSIIKVDIENLNEVFSNEIFDVGIYLSSDQSIEPSEDIRICEIINYDSIGKEIKELSAECKVSQQVQDGQYYLGAYVDTGGFITESNENNNSSCMINVIAVSSPVQNTGNIILQSSVTPQILNISESFEATGTVFLDNTPLNNADIYGIIEGINFSFHTQTDSFGYFNLPMTAPQIPGFYTVTVSALNNGEGVSNEHTLNVNDPVSGHDLSINSFSLSKDYMSPESTVNLTAVIQNKGEFEESDVEVVFELRDPTGKIVDNKKVQISLNPNTTQPYEALLQSGSEIGDYTASCMIIISNDYDTSNNSYQKLIYVGFGPHFYELVERNAVYPGYIGMQKGIYYGIPDTNDKYDVMIDGYDKSHTPERVRVYVKIRNDNGYIIDGPKFIEKNGFQLFDNNRLAIEWEFVSYEKLYGVYQYLFAVTPWTSSSNLVQTNPETLYVSTGEKGSTYIITDPYHIDEIYLKPGMPDDDFETVNSWSHGVFKFYRSNRECDYFFDVPSSAQDRKYDVWLLVRTDERPDHLQRLQIIVNKQHDVGIESVDHDTSAVAGTVVSVLGEIYNTGGYNEPLAEVILLVTNQDGYSYQTSKNISLNIQERSNIQLEWPTFGLPSGEYNICVSVRVEGDNITENNSQTTNIMIDKPPYILSINPSSGHCGDLIKINGEGFGSGQENSNILFSNSIEVNEVISWSDNEIICKIPEGAENGCVIVKNNKSQSNCSILSVLVDIPGDLNEDSIVDMGDVNIIRAYINQPSSNCPSCDIDGDGTITILDARKIVTMCDCPRCTCP